MGSFRLILAWAVLCGSPVLAGPPFVTDDPEPADYQHFEINLAVQGSVVRGSRNANLPNLDINYGALPGLQLHVGLTAPFQSASGSGADYGYGDTEFGLKYRFIEEDEEGWQPQLAVYPNIDLPTGDASRGLGSGHTKIFLPIWVQKSFGEWQSFGGGGYWLNQQGRQDRNYWFFGWALLRKFSDQWTLGGELFHQTADLTHSPTQGGDGLSARDSSGFNLGGYYTLDEDHHIMLTLGRGLQTVPTTNQFSYYVGYQIIF